MAGGCMGKYCVIDLTKQKTEVVELEEDFYKKHGEHLHRKLEQKVFQLEETNAKLIAKQRELIKLNDQLALSKTHQSVSLSFEDQELQVLFTKLSDELKKPVETLQELQSNLLKNLDNNAEQQALQAILQLAELVKALERLSSADSAMLENNKPGLELIANKILESLKS